jgi:hypothetical protein
MKPLPCVEPAVLPEPFATDVARVELIGPCVRAILGARQVSFLDGSQEIIINARLVLTRDCAVQLARELLAAVEHGTEPATTFELAGFRSTN